MDLYSTSAAAEANLDSLPIQSGGGISRESMNDIRLDAEGTPPSFEAATSAFPSSQPPSQPQPLLDFDFTPNTQTQPPQFGSGPIKKIQFHEGEPTRKFKNSFFHKILLPS